MFALPTLSLAATFPEAGISTKIPVVGRIDNATQSWSGSLITNFDV